MPSSLVYDVDVDVPAAQMYGYFTTVGYWEDLVGTLPEPLLADRDRPLLVRQRPEPTSPSRTSCPRRICRRCPAGDFGFVHRQTRAALRSVRHRPIAVGRYRADVPVPLDLTGDYVLPSTPNRGSRMRLTTSLPDAVPIIGGQIEQLVLGGLKSMFAGEGEFTAEWVAAHR